MVSVMEVDDETPAVAESTSPMIEVISSTTTMGADEPISTSTDHNSKVLEPWEERLLDAQEILSLSTTTTLRPTTRMHLESLGKRLQKEAEALQRVAGSSQKSSTPGASNQNPTVSTATSPVSTTATIPLSSTVKYVPIDRFGFDAGGYNEPFVTLYIELDKVGTVRDSVTCQFTKASFDLIISNLNQKSYRLYKDCLEKEIDPDKSKFTVKANKVIVKLAKVKTSEYGGFDYWTKLSDPKKSKDDTKKKDDPSASIMDMMKQMYNEGDDNMKKIIGETMMKQRNGELNQDKPGMPDFGKSGLDDMDDDM